MISGIIFKAVFHLCYMNAHRITSARSAQEGTGANRILTTGSHIAYEYPPTEVSSELIAENVRNEVGSQEYRLHFMIKAY